ncbi:tRNA (N6-isopentenyl adenosine(37)-C2)-methylthiotransferase MiaB [Anaerosinus gibii]|uniref:tRNA-2-methylthio-N(6)-dimethylallyladenosine synthase n=1 Tax=Selenobaculum gibii TaxID=3054208 RepID=A0A9Y2ET85_9FIRM|nr:tRNA (N6-isopentenyl adenosine(37)-C2)-methylthiotransferase MiaB [Selenobaculum gbiensis]WIW69680.1 tRNA (N6-isopentenyl adenosine(37)-C2)-methylthiotransferase MiaB [Selenobaculum gbiensis]
MQNIKQKFVSFLTYGCQMNENDSERLAGQLKNIGYEKQDDLSLADLIIVNTCCVRESAENKIYGKIGNLKRLKTANPNLIIGITGCMAQKDGDAILKKASHVDFVMGTNKIHEISNIIAEVEQSHGRVVNVIQGDQEMPGDLPTIRNGSISTWIPIMYGCNNFCTYCIVPYVRGRERSRDLEDILKEVRDVASQGFKEITLLGQNVNSYGKDSASADFADLLTAVDKIEGIERIRYMTSHPRDLNDKVIDAIKNSRHICEQFHLPVQYGNDTILKSMNRGYTTDDYRNLVRKIRAAVPHASITTDLIVGFPGETEETFQDTLNFLKEIRYDAAYTFLYSKRSGTPAAEMQNQVSTELKKKRLQQLMDVQNQISLEINQQLEGRVLEVMVEGSSKTDENVLSGRTRTNKIVLWDKVGHEAVGQLVQIKITHPQTWVLKGELI